MISFFGLKILSVFYSKFFNAIDFDKGTIFINLGLFLILKSNDLDKFIRFKVLLSF